MVEPRIELEVGLLEAEIDGGRMRGRGEVQPGRRRKDGVGLRLGGEAGDTFVDVRLGGVGGGPNCLEVTAQGGVQVGAEVC